MTKFSISRDPIDAPGRNYGLTSGQYFELDALFRRLERFERGAAAERTSAVTSLARRRDAELLEHGGAFEAAWAHELAALIDMKRLRTPEAEALARSARAATALIAAKIETAAATTLDGLKVKARAILWRRNGEPLGTSIAPAAHGEDARVAAPAARAS